MRTLRALATLAAWTLIGAVFGLLAVISGPALFGHRSFVVMSGSMEPTISTGDVVIDEQVSPLEVRPGDVITFRAPGSERTLITHRVIDVTIEGNAVGFVTKGDANSAPERWRIPADGVLGRVRYKLPKVGYALALARSRQGRVGLVLVPALILAAYALRRIWHPRSEGTLETA